ncbi:MAG TPA: ABC transporter ATP-binding protein [Rugosimonospora sp.]|nr:ABC transporter ATP-binding protein [Rugosimonospora sp.]
MSALMTDGVAVKAEATEFAIAGRRRYDRRGPARWVLSHQLRNPWALLGFVVGSLVMVALNSTVPGLVGRAFDAVTGDAAGRRGALTAIVVALLVIVGLRSGFDLLARLCTEVLANRIQRDARDELYLSLLGKSQTFHNRQRVGDLMARGASDIRQLGLMFSPGIDLIVDSGSQAIIPVVFIGFLDWRLLGAPLVFLATFVLSLRHFTRRLQPVSIEMRERVGELSAVLSESVRGIEVVKATAQERQEAAKFTSRASAYRDAFVAQGQIQARYLPTLLLAVCTAGALLHGLYLHSRGQLTIGQLVSYLGLMGLLGFPAFISIFSFSMVQTGLASARRILELMTDESELDHNEAGHRGTIRGVVTFDNVTFGYGDRPVLRDLSFTIEPGQTVAIVGEAGAGKTTLTKLVNRGYDVTAGRVLVDGIDVRDWNLDALRSQISAIEQDIVLFSRSVAQNIAFGVGQRATRAQIEAAARDAQAGGFIGELPDGYDTVIGERGVTLSGGQRQRLAIARALLTDPAILVLDDSTSAIDSATEDEIQQAIRRVLQGRTTLLITHRLAQVRWADKVLLLRRGELVDAGSHEQLLARCPLYQRIFAHYGTVPRATEVD